MRFSDALADLREAVAFLTRLPLAARGERAAAAAGATRAYPLVGAGLALVAWLVYLLAEGLGLQPLAAALLAVAALLLATGALHEDGLADTVDGFGGGRDRDEKLAIMRDSRTGNYGVLALVLTVTLRAAALAALARPGAVLAGLLAAASLSRALLPLLMLLERPARPDGLAAGLGRPEPATVGQALALGFLFAWLGLGLFGALLAMLLAAGATLLVAGLARRQIGGYSGDVLGALQQVVETALLLLAVVLL